MRYLTIVTIGSHATAHLVQFAVTHPQDALDRSSTPTEIATAVGFDNFETGSWGRAKTAVRIAVHQSPAAAQAAFERKWEAIPGAELRQSAAYLLEAFRSHGECGWHPDGLSKLTCGDLADPAEPVAVLTTAGWDFKTDDDTLRALSFAERSAEVRLALFEASGLRAAVPCFVGITDDPFTFSVWESAHAMQAFAYKQEPHRPHMKSALANRAQMFDRSSFTRFRVLTQRGSWISGDATQA